ncbi:hypothetical protein GQ457_18G011220 [Hibiscus cannabinus]
MEVANDTVIKKPKRLTSVVWNHFERVRKADICYAVCVHCNKKLSGSSNSGTTHLRNHLMRCLKRFNYDVSQLLSAKKMKKDNTLTIANISYDEGQRKEDFIKPAIVKYEPDHRKEEVFNLQSSWFDQERSRLDLARMIILHGYPLTMVDHVGFNVFVRNLQPLFDVALNNAIEVSCMEIYGKERQKVHDMLSKLRGSVNLTVEMWSSLENSNHVCITAHYVGDDWKLQKKILNFVTLDSSHTDDLLSEVIIKCLMDWDIESKLFAVTLDDFSATDAIILRIKEQISENKSRLINGQVLDVRSAAHVINSVVQDAMEALRVVIQKIRGSIQYVKSSQSIQGKFQEMAQQTGIDSQKNLVLDFPIRWNSTYVMLETAIQYKDAFCQLPDLDLDLTLSDEEWEWASFITGYLKLFIEIISVFSSNKCPTANIYFPEICHVHIQLIDWCKSPNDFLSSLAAKMKAKFDKYWSKCSLSLAVAAILDPRFKMKLVEYYYSQIYGSIALERIKEVSDGLKELFNTYTICSTLIDQDSSLPHSSLAGSGNDGRDRLKGFDKFLHETSQSQSAISDLEKYLDEPVFPRNCDFNILNWWRVHTPRYPILSMMARDVLGTPMSTVSQESAFNAGGRVLDSSRSSLAPDTLQALICTQDWLQIQSDDSGPSSSHYALPLYVETN